MTKTIKSQKGFTLIEVLIVTVLLGGIISISLHKMNMTSSLVQTMSGSIMSSCAEIETSFGNYVDEKKTMPTGLTDTNFVPQYLFVPNAIQNFDASYGTNGYVLAQQTGQTTGNNGWYISARVEVTSTSDPKYKAIITASNKLSPMRFFYNSAGPASVTNNYGGGSSLVYITYWLIRS